MITKPFKLIALLAMLYTASVILPQNLQAHCQIPCGIYDDHARLQSMLEDATTIKKAMIMLAELADKDDLQSRNQTVRWVVNKESHAQNIISTISDYYLTQRVNPSQEDYAERLAKHHAVIIAAMKAKQNTDRTYTKTLIKSIQELEVYYPEPDHKH